MELRAESIIVPATVLLIAWAATFIPTGLTAQVFPGAGAAAVDATRSRDGVPSAPRGRADVVVPAYQGYPRQRTETDAADGADPAHFDPRPMERPTVVRIWRTDREGAIARLTSTLRGQGFAESARDIERGEIRASRRDGERSGARDEVLLWIEGQAGDAERVRIYADFGRFERVSGRGESRRVRLDSDQIERRFGQLRNALQSTE